jgi:hypothetical protein
MGLKVCTLFCVFACVARLLIDKYLENGNNCLLIASRTNESGKQNKDAILTGPTSYDTSFSGKAQLYYCGPDTTSLCKIPNSSLVNKERISMGNK